MEKEFVDEIKAVTTEECWIAQKINHEEEDGGGCVLGCVEPF